MTSPHPFPLIMSITQRNMANMHPKSQEVNTKGAFLLIHNFINGLPTPTTPATIVNVVTAGAWGVFPQISGYAISKLAALQLVANVATAYPNITAIALHPGLVKTDMFHPSFNRFNLDSPALVGGVTVWLAGEKAKFLTGRTITSNWSVEDLVERKAEIEAGDLLKIGLQGKFGKDQFE
jgi:NAD(P)-dependent dehydrogenase (short-subunit alcohol dehydrogenase family)